MAKRAVLTALLAVAVGLSTTTPVVATPRTQAQALAEVCASPDRAADDQAIAVALDALCRLDVDPLTGALRVNPFLNPLLCPILAALANIFIAVVIYIATDGDVFVLGALVWDCPPYREGGSSR